MLLEIELLKKKKKKKKSIKLHQVWAIPSSETQGQLVGTIQCSAGESLLQE